MLVERLYRGCILLSLLLVVALTEASAQPNDPVADPRATVISGQARFTVLTPQLIRMEWSEDRQFEDRASLVFVHRRLPVPAFSVSSDGDWLILESEKLLLKYKKDSGRFTQDNLEVQFDLNGGRVAWHPGMKDTANLGGTIRTLDGVRGSTPLESGLLSRDGWVLVDDSERPLFDGSDWPWVIARPGGERQDWYFFGYGHEYKKALYDYTRVAGKIPMPPRFAFGLWWSRYWQYTDQEFMQLVHEFEVHDVPLDVLVIDMDWHHTFELRWWKDVQDQASQRLGWTGYTWNKILFPDPAGFLHWCESAGLKTPLNLHPASGIQPHEEKYPEMAEAMGIDPASQEYVPFDIVDKQFARNYLDIVLRPLEEQGVDFWWLDWQQWSTTKIPGVTPTWWLNYVFFSDMERRGKARPLIMHRWGGLGNHRYQIGFSGDAISVWESLAFQPYFTATAGNVGFGYWSHDIGGHMPGIVSPEVYTRWVQFGVFSPILRTHTTKNPEAERRIWAYPVDYFLAMRDAFLLRYALVPYIYTAARNAYDAGVSICRPMYYDYPEAREAYDFKDQYMFGDDMLVAPIAAPMSPDSLLARKTIWLPEGTWIEWFTGTRCQGATVVERTFALDEIPVYVKAGSIIPMQPKMRHTREKPVDPLILAIFPGDSGSTRIYEDEGNTLGYERGKCAWTTVHHMKLKDGTWRIDVLPTEGSYAGMKTRRDYEIRLPGEWPPEAVLYNGKPVPYTRSESAPSWRYDGSKLTIIILLPGLDVSKKAEVQVKLPLSLDSELLDGVPGKLARLQRVMTLLNNLWPKGWSPESLIDLVQTGHRIELEPARTLQELEKLERDLPEVINQIASLEGERTLINRALNHLSSLRKR